MIVDDPFGNRALTEAGFDERRLRFRALLDRWNHFLRGEKVARWIMQSAREDCMAIAEQHVYADRFSGIYWTAIHRKTG